MKRLFILFLLLVTTHVATAQNDVCVPVALGVPTREGPPKWVAWTGSGPIAPDPSLDDPRWLGSTGQTFERGSAKAPLQTRALYANQGGQEYLYLSFIIDIDAFDIRAGHESVMRKRDVFLGFRRPDTSGVEKAYIFQFHLTGSGSGVSTPQACDSTAACDEDTIPSTTTPFDYWRVYVDKGNTNVEGCSGNHDSGHQYVAMLTASVPWMSGVAPEPSAIQYWKVASSDPAPLLQNRWAVQVRIPMVAPVAAATSAIGSGIEKGSTFFYEATASLDRQSLTDPLIDVGEFARIGWFPPTLTNTVCPDVDVLIHPEPTDLAVLTTSNSPPPTAPCDGGLTIDRDHVGVLFNALIPTGAAAFQAFRPDKQFKAHDLTTPNHVIALPVNDSASSITAPVQGRFRLAGWGSAPWSSTTDTGTWKDIRGAANGICAAGTSPACTPVAIAPHEQGLITFDWTIGADPVIGASEYCEFGLTPPAADEACSLVKCSCADVHDCAANTGVQAAKHGGGFWPCVPSIYQFDQCMLVELNSPNGNATFVHQSTWSNMSFGQMSVLAHEALIDARQLPTAPGQQFQDIFFIAMPRNMPGSVPPTSTSVQLAQNAALDAATRIAQPYIDDLQRVPGPKIAEIIKRLNRQAIDVKIAENDDRLRKILAARQIMPDADAHRIDGLVKIVLGKAGGDKPSATQVHDIVNTVGSSTAAEIVPTLEIYPFYQPFGRGKVYSPMTSFSVFLSHEQTLAGMHYEIDGADKAGENVYHMRIPIGTARKIQIRAQALVGGEAVLPPGMPKWPCAGCACGGVGAQKCGLVTMVGNTAPGLIAGVLVIRRRRKKTAKPAKPAN